MLTIAICDDEVRVLPELRKQIDDTLRKQDMQAEFLLFDSCEACLEAFDQHEIDFLFLDIDMPKMSGFDLAKRLQERENQLHIGNTLLVFVTNQDALVYESFSFHPFAFIRKAYFQQEIEAVISRMLVEYRKVPEFYTIHMVNEIVRVEVNSMIYFEAQGNYVRLVTTKGEYRFRETLGSLSEQLEPAGFIRIHKGFLVNQIFIVAIRQNEIELEHQELLPLGRTNRDSVRSKLMKYLR